MMQCYLVLYFITVLLLYVFDYPLPLTLVTALLGDPSSVSFLLVF